MKAFSAVLVAGFIGAVIMGAPLVSVALFFMSTCCAGAAVKISIDRAPVQPVRRVYYPAAKIHHI